MNFKKEIAKLIEIDGLNYEQIADMLEPIPDQLPGDMAFPCFRLAKIMRKSPVLIAQQLVESVKIGDIIEKAQAVNGYLNIFLNKINVAKRVLSEVEQCGEAYGESDIGKNKTICIDYSSVNIAKPFHIGHLGTTAIGGALYKIYKKLGYNVVGINHLGDYGTQFGKLIVAFKLWSSKEEIEKGGVRALQQAYVRFHKEEESNTELTEMARSWFLKVEEKDAEAMELFNYFKEITLKEVNKIYNRLNISFDSWNGESFYSDKMQPVLDDLRAKNLTKISDGAEIVDLSDYGMPPCLLVKSNGGTLYATRDMATAHYRKKTYDFYKCLYVVAYQQNLHFKQFFKVLELEGCSWAKDLVHVAYGMVSLVDGSMSTRKGNVVWLSDVLDNAVEKALDIIMQKSPDLSNKEEIAESIGVGAVIFSALCNSRIKDITFSLDRVLSFEGETAPYLQYTHARCMSLIEKNGHSSDYKCDPDYTSIDNSVALELIKLIGVYNHVLCDVAEKYEPSILSNYLIDTAKAFNKLYMECRIYGESDSVKKARLMVVEATQIILNSGLKALGIKPVSKM
ncbi:MAG: arginine--tRNA ligase [Clostridia bacterium]